MFIGKDGFIWWIGVVESNLDPEVLGRCKVRIFGYHPAHSEAKVSNDELPWAVTIHPANTPNLFAVPQPGEWVFGFFLDGQDAKEPAILGYIPANPDSDSPTFASKGSPAQAVKNKINIIRNFHRASTTSDAANSVIWEHGNHIIEMAKNGSIYIEHKSGSYINMTFNGDVAVYSANNLYLSANNNVVIQAQKGSISSTANVNFNVIANNNIATTSGNNATLIANNAVQVTAKNAGLTIANTIAVVSNTINTTANTGNFSITNVTFTSNSITLNSSGVITVDAGGTLTLDGSTINLG